MGKYVDTNVGVKQPAEGKQSTMSVCVYKKRPVIGKETYYTMQKNSFCASFHICPHYLTFLHFIPHLYHICNSWIQLSS